MGIKHYWDVCAKCRLSVHLNDPADVCFSCGFVGDPVKVERKILTSLERVDNNPILAIFLFICAIISLPFTVFFLFVSPYLAVFNGAVTGAFFLYSYKNMRATFKGRCPYCSTFAKDIKIKDATYHCDRCKKTSVKWGTKYDGYLEVK